MSLDVRFRPAVAADARKLAELIAISSDGVAVIEWSEEAARNPGLEPLDVGELIYARDSGNYSYRNCVVADNDGEVIGVLLSFPMGEADEPPAPGPPFDGSDVFAPYKYLEAPNTWYVCGVALFPDYRRHGIGTQLMDIARRQAVDQGYDQLSLVAFEQNLGSVRLYQRLGFEIVDRAPVVPHPLIRYAGEALLMVADTKNLQRPS